MKKITALLCIVIAAVCLLTACGKTEPPVPLVDEPTIELGESEYFSQEELQKGADIVKETMEGWNVQCNIQKISYAGDDTSLLGLYYCDLMVDEDNKYDACMVFYSDFVTPADAKGMEKNHLYENWQWVIVKDEDGEWKFFNNGQSTLSNVDVPDDLDLKSLINLD